MENIKSDKELAVKIDLTVSNLNAYLREAHSRGLKATVEQLDGFSWLNKDELTCRSVKPCQLIVTVFKVEIL